ncbi:hypothetical protein C8F04DRAFT_1195098 [Mycena alexandri]|uniref:Uncharacterized protein n=1 Tax=Mycena alexandri TaxID=1745969 RepID=A0AAD6S6K5_9AGAR|nr:hypothetical protein C8F04DRAFT_1195098 [Mycena alexandri]
MTKTPMPRPFIHRRIPRPRNPCRRSRHILEVNTYIPFIKTASMKALRIKFGDGNEIGGDVGSMNGVQDEFVALTLEDEGLSHNPRSENAKFRAFSSAALMLDRSILHKVLVPPEAMLCCSRVDHHSVVSPYRVRDEHAHGAPTRTIIIIRVVVRLVRGVRGRVRIVIEVLREAQRAAAMRSVPRDEVEVGISDEIQGDSV